MTKYTCVCCGAPINRITGRCDYCGTMYDIGHEYPVIRMETFTNPVREYKACLLVDRDLAMVDGEEYMRYAIEQLARNMLPAVVEGMQIRTYDHDFEAIAMNKRRLEGSVRIVIPKERTV